MSRLSSQASNALLSQALETSFRGYQPYHRPIPLAEVVGKLRATYHSACHSSDAELRVVVTKYAVAHGFNLGSET